MSTITDSFSLHPSSFIPFHRYYLIVVEYLSYSCSAISRDLVSCIIHQVPSWIAGNLQETTMVIRSITMGSGSSLPSVRWRLSTILIDFWCSALNRCHSLPGLYLPRKNCASWHWSCCFLRIWPSLSSARSFRRPRRCTWTWNWNCTEFTDQHWKLRSTSRVSSGRTTTARTWKSQRWSHHNSAWLSCSKISSSSV